VVIGWRVRAHIVTKSLTPLDGAYCRALYLVYTIEQTSSKCTQITRAIARSLLNVYSMFARCLLDRVNGVLLFAHWSVHQKLNRASSVQFSSIMSLCARFNSYTLFTRWSKHEAKTWSKREVNLEHTSCTCIFNTFVSSLFYVCFIV